MFGDEILNFARLLFLRLLNQTFRRPNPLSGLVLKASRVDFEVALVHLEFGWLVLNSNLCFRLYDLNHNALRRVVRQRVQLSAARLGF